MNKLEEQIIKNNTILTIIINSILALAKLVGGFFGGSAVLIADGVNSLSDILTNFVVLISARFSKKERDKEHPYGHEKFDSMVSIFLGFILLITAFSLGKDAVIRFYEIIFKDHIITKPLWYTWVIAGFTIVIKEFLFRKTIVDAKKSKSQALTAQAWDHRSDTIVSFGAVVGIIGAIFGIGFLDPLASMLIAIFILRLAFKIIRTGVSQVVDESADSEILEQIKRVVLKNENVRTIDDIRTRMFGLSIYVDLEISLDSSLSLELAHEIAEDIHDSVESEIADVIHCMIHVNPYKKPN